jgi:hypothetical protein
MISKLLIPAVLENYTPRADKSFSLRFSTQLLTTEQKLIIDKLHQSFVYLMIKESEIDNAEQKQMDSLQVEIGDQKKTPGQRLRAVMYLLWKQDSEGFATADEYYKNKMENIILFYRGKLKD